eukprot:NODE_204_length_14945_cov_0.251313.p4 type:complete len:282 gc:universal NODE_204_length_14945_cov_0.251313:10262-11107(+)
MSEVFFRGFDEAFYIAFGCAIMANSAALVVSPVLLLRDWRKNLLAVLSNLFLIVSNWTSYAPRHNSSLGCEIKSYTIQVFMILGSLSQVLAPLSRSFFLLENKYKKSVIGLIFLLTIAEFCSLVDLNYSCDEESSRFAAIHINPYSNVFANLLGFCIYAIAFYQVVKLINSSVLTKENNRMQVVKRISIGSIYLTGAIKIGCLVGYIIDGDGYNGEGDNEIEMTLKSCLSCAIIFCFLFLELCTRAKDSVENSDLAHQHSKGNGFTSSNKKEAVVSISVKE